MPNYLSKEKLFEATDGGLEIIISYYPDAVHVADKKKTHFAIRDEKTPSASLRRAENGLWYVTDFGGDGKAKNAIEIVMLEEQLDFKDAIKYIGDRFKIANDGTVKTYESGFEKRKATDDEPEGEYFFDLKKELSENDFKVIFPRYKEPDRKRYERALDKYNISALISFTQIKNRQALITKSTDHYPIFLIEGPGFKKIYQPLNKDKKYRFRYTGNRPKDFVFGLRQLGETYNRLNKESHSQSTDLDEEAKPEDLSEKKVPEVIICSGDRDALNVAAMGYEVIWLNSETASFDKKLYSTLRKKCERVYNLPDIDKTGVREGTKLALEYLDVCTIWLPDHLRNRKDFRGNSCKDLRDYLRYYSEWDFKQLTKTAVACRMYDAVVSERGLKYNFNNVQCYEFLRLNGFYRFKSNNEKTGYIYIRIISNVVHEVKVEEIRGFVNAFLLEKKEPVDLRNSFYRTNQLGEGSLSNLPLKEIDFTDYDKTTQFLFFNNVTWEVGPKRIREHEPGSLNKFVWADEIIDHAVNLDKDYFQVRYDNELDRYHIDIKENDCLFFRYLINGSRVYWRKELEQGEPLDPEEIYEQDLHLINKLYALGYLLHRYRDPNRPWCVFIMDQKMADTGESHGGSGKSIYAEAPFYFMKHVDLPGRNPKLTDNPHLFENVTEHTDYVRIDDANQYMKFHFFFSAITGSLNVNPKGLKQFVIPFEKVPKFSITSNFPPRDLDGSTLRRLLYVVFSDYYHNNETGEYREDRSPYDEFGKNLFKDFNSHDWKLFFNLMAQCIKLYLNFSKINPPLDDAKKRSYLSLMTETFKNWADVYFSSESERFDKAVIKKDAFEDFITATRLKTWTATRFGKALRFWCLYHGYEFNPPEVCNSNGRIVKNENHVTTEFVYIRSVSEVNELEPF
ncbi:MAG: hypothetical protein AAGF85_00520 [Bacteroidota bacterium]